MEKEDLLNIRSNLNIQLKEITNYRDVRVRNILFDYENYLNNINKYSMEFMFYHQEIKKINAQICLLNELILIYYYD